MDILAGTTNAQTGQTNIKRQLEDFISSCFHLTIFALNFEGRFLLRTHAVYYLYHYSDFLRPFVLADLILVPDTCRQQIHDLTVICILRTLFRSDLCFLWGFKYKVTCIRQWYKCRCKAHHQSDKQPKVKCWDVCLAEQSEWDWQEKTSTYDVKKHTHNV